MSKVPTDKSIKLARKLAKFFSECGTDYTPSDVLKAAFDIDSLINKSKKVKKK